MIEPRQTGGLVGVGAGVGIALGAMVGATTENWTWTPIVLAGCIALGALAASLSRR